MRYFIDDNLHVRVERDNVTELVGDITQTETNRIDAETVEDITYQFVISEDDESGEYVEQSRTTRSEPEPLPEPSEIDLIGMQLVDKDIQIMELQSQNETLGQQVVAMDLRLLQLEMGAIK